MAAKIIKNVKHMTKNPLQMFKLPKIQCILSPFNINVTTRCTPLTNADNHKVTLLVRIDNATELQAE